jgi:hypothetical protein
MLSAVHDGLAFAAAFAGERLSGGDGLQLARAVLSPHYSATQPRRKQPMRILVLSLTMLPLLALPASAADDPRQPVTMPGMMQEHMRANMRDHLLALGEIQAALAAAQYDAAAEIAERRLGMTSLDAHGARHVAGFMLEACRPSAPRCTTPPTGCCLVRSSPSAVSRGVRHETAVAFSCCSARTGV